MGKLTVAKVDLDIPENIKMNKYIKYTFYGLIFALIGLSMNACTTTKKQAKPIYKVQRLSQADQKSFDYFFYEGLDFKNQGKYDQALESFMMCFQLDSIDAGLSSEMGMLYAAVNLSNEALYCFEQAAKYDPTNWWFGIQLISAYAQSKRIDDAIQVAEKFRSTFPYKEEVYQMLASLYKQNKQYEKAIEAFNRLESISGIDENLAIQKFHLYSEIKKPQKAIAEIDKLISKFPTESRFQVVRGDIYLQQKMPEKAFQIFQDVLKTDPDNPFVYLSLSDYYNVTNEPEKANESIVKALKNDRLEVEQKIEILGEYVQKFTQDSVRFSETEALFKMLVDRYPMEEQVLGYYSVFLQFRKRNPEAISILESMININPKNEQTWFQLIQIYLSEQKYQQVLEVAKNAIDNLPQIAQWYFYQGIAHFQLQQFDEALKAHQEALTICTEKDAALKTDIYSQMGDIYYKKNNTKEAFLAYDEALKLSPTNIFVMNNYAYYLSVENLDLKKAENMSAKTVEKEPANSTYLDTYAWIFYQQANYSLAKFYIERAVDNLKPGTESGVIYEHYGDILLATGDAVNALKMWQKSIELGNVTPELNEKIKKGLSTPKEQVK